MQKKYPGAKRPREKTDPSTIRVGIKDYKQEEDLMEVYGEIEDAINSYDDAYVELLTDHYNNYKETGVEGARALRPMDEFYYRNLALRCIEPMQRGQGMDGVKRGVGMFIGMSMVDKKFRQHTNNQLKRMMSDKLTSCAEFADRHGFDSMADRIRNQRDEIDAGLNGGRKKFTAKKAALQEMALIQATHEKLNVDGLDYNQLGVMMDTLVYYDYSDDVVSSAREKLVAYGLDDSVVDEYLKPRNFRKNGQIDRLPSKDKDFMRQMGKSMEADGLKYVDIDKIYSDYAYQKEAIEVFAEKDGVNLEDKDQSLRILVGQYVERHPEKRAAFKELVEGASRDGSHIVHKDGKSMRVWTGEFSHRDGEAVYSFTPAGRVMPSYYMEVMGDTLNDYVERSIRDPKGPTEDAIARDLSDMLVAIRKGEEYDSDLYVMWSESMQNVSEQNRNELVQGALSRGMGLLSKDREDFVDNFRSVHMNNFTASFEDAKEDVLDKTTVEEMEMV